MVLVKKVLVAMSGGVDSSVAALLLKTQGYEVTGCIMQTLPGMGSAIQDAKTVAETLGIPFQVFDVQKEFEKEIIASFIASYEKGETPNPCIWCNKQLKFGLLLEKAQALGCDYLATGHYVRLVDDPKSGRRTVQCAEDLTKDQSYMLWSLSQEQLAHILFPLGGMTKPEVRALAEEYHLVTAKKSDSQDICFVPDGDYAGFIRSHTVSESPAGQFVDTTGRVLGTHKGLIHYTVGQRRGLGLSLPAPLYVKEKRTEDNTVVLCPDNELFENRLVAREVNWMKIEAPTVPVQALVKIRYHHKPQTATIRRLEDDTWEVVFDQPVRAVTPGQSVVFYDDQELLGGGIIC